MRNFQEQGIIIAKIGTDTLVRNRQVDKEYVSTLADQVAHVRRSGSGIAVVSSGALLVGGQEYLTDAWREALAPHGVVVAETLFSDETLDSGINQVRRALVKGQMPLINGDHSTTLGEITGNNDYLAAAVAMRLPAQGVVFLTNVDGVLDNSGKVMPKLVAHEEVVFLGSSTNGTGGMIKKVAAARTIAETGRVVIANGRRRNVLVDFAARKNGFGTHIVQ